MQTCQNGIFPSVPPCITVRKHFQMSIVLSFPILLLCLVFLLSYFLMVLSLFIDLSLIICFYFFFLVVSFCNLFFSFLIFFLLIVIFCAAFQLASKFNSDVSKWATSRCTNMAYST